MSFGTRRFPTRRFQSSCHRFELTSVYFLASRTLDSFSDSDHHDHMVVVRVGSPVVMDQMDNAGKLQCSLFLLSSPSSFRSRVWSRAVKVSALGGLSLTFFSSFQTPDTHLCAAIRPSSDLLACTSRTTRRDTSYKTRFHFYPVSLLVLAHRASSNMSRL